MIKGEDLPQLHLAPPQHPKWMKIKKSTAPQVDEDQEKDDPQSQDNVPTPTPQVQEQEEQNVPPQAQVTHDTPQQASTQAPLVKHGRISKDHPIGQIIGSPSKGVRTR